MNISFKKSMLIIVALSIAGSIFDIMFFKSNLYQDITGAWMLFFIRTFIELMCGFLGTIGGYALFKMEKTL
jgi:hypothetical protein